MGIKLNLTEDEVKGAQGGGFKPAPAGEYVGVIYDIKLSKGKTSGKPMFVVDLKPTEGELAKGKRTFRTWVSLTPAAVFKLVELNKAVGFPYPKGDTAQEFEVADANEYLSLKVNFVLEQEPYESEDEDGNDVTLYRNVVKRIKQYNPDVLLEDAAEDTTSGGLFLGQ